MGWPEARLIAGCQDSIGSAAITQFGGPARDGYDDVVARITANVIGRLVDPEPFEPPI